MDRPPRELLTLWPKIFRRSRYATLYRNNNFEIPQDYLFFIQNKSNDTRIFFKMKNYITNIFPSFNREPMVTNWRWSADSYHWRYDQGARRQQKEALGYQIQDILQQRYTEMVSIQGCPQRWPSGKFTHQLCCDALRVFWFQLRTLRVDYCDHAGACYEVLW